MNADVIHTINQEIYRRFPEVKGKKPRVQPQSIASTRQIAKAKTYLLIYQGQVVTADRKTMPRMVRVVADEQGKILKISTSR